MEKFDYIIIGFGKAGKTIAAFLSERGKTVALIEKSPKMYGGTCINVACLPSKNLITAAERKPDERANDAYYAESVQNKKSLIKKLNNANFHNVDDLENGQVIDGTAHFTDEHTVTIVPDSGESVDLYGEHIIINTGSSPNIPGNIEGIAALMDQGAPYYTSENLMDEENYPERLTIIGDGFIGLEFASMFSQFGTKVTVLADHAQEEFLKNEDHDVVEYVYDALVGQGIEFIFNASTTKASKDGQIATLTYTQDGTEKEISSEAVLVSVGRHANVDGLKLENAGVELDDNHTIVVDKHLQTTRDNIFAVGDVKGGPQFTYVSLDDNRILKSTLFGDGSYNLETRNVVPTSTFIEPTFASVGLTEKAAKDAGYNIKVSTLPVESIPKAKVLSRTTGIYKAVVDSDTNQILGVRLFGEEAHETINIISTAMNGHLPYTALRDQIYTHPTMSEALNDLFRNID